MKQIFKTGTLLLLFTGTALAGVLRQDLRNLLNYENLGMAAIGLGMAGSVHPWDDNLRGELESSLLVEGSLDAANLYGASHFNLPASLGLWVLGKTTRQQKLEIVGESLVRTLAFTQLVVAPIKFTVRRQRPDRSNRLSFPSGHTANSFAVARVLHRHYGLRVGIPLYVFSGFVAAGRLEDERHYLSDVVMGAVLGTVVGNSVTLDRDEHIAVLPAVMSDRVMLTLYIRP